MSKDDEIGVAKKFLALPREKQEEIHAKMSALFQKLEQEWKADPKNIGKTFSYSKMWDEFTANKKADEKMI